MHETPPGPDPAVIAGARARRFIIATLTIAGNAAARENVRHAPRIEIGAILLSVLDRVEDWLERRGQRLRLAEMTSDQLKDVGLTRADVAREIAKPFWRA